MSHRPSIDIEARRPHFIGRCSICETTVTAEGPDGDDGEIAADGKPIHYVCEDRARVALEPDPCPGSDSRYDDGRCRADGCGLQVGTYNDGPAGERLVRHHRPLAKVVLSGEWLYDGEKNTHGYEAHSATFTGAGGSVEAYVSRDVMEQLVADHAKEREACPDLDVVVLTPDGAVLVVGQDGHDHVIAATPDGNYRLPGWMWYPVLPSDCVTLRATRLPASWQEHRGDVAAALAAGHVEIEPDDDQGRWCGNCLAPSTETEICDDREGSGRFLCRPCLQGQEPRGAGR